MMNAPMHEGLVEHAGIDRVMRELVEAIDRPGSPDVAPLLDVLAVRLRAHLAREDIDIARFASVDAEDAKLLLSNHADIRTSVERLVARATTGSLSRDDIHHLKLMVSLHEAHEETGLYRWASARG